MPRTLCREAAIYQRGWEREQLWAVMLERLPALDDFQATAPGPIPMVVLTRQ
ncbi:hypothetical protein EDD99_7123 [Streptomyces sp. 846.5]|nr:hypothetical protein [Streptomyces sp. 846.5]TDT95298.1 hypothetical protein EDD99_7123 [Streptomyces sp. 846.5]